MYVEFVVQGALGELAASAFPEFVIEQQQILVTSESNALAALDRLTDYDVEVVVIRRPGPCDLH